METQILEDILRIIRLQLGKRAIQANDRLVEDLGAESADVMNIIAAAEEKFGIIIKEAEIARILTAQDLYELVQQRSDSMQPPV